MSTTNLNQVDDVEFSDEIKIFKLKDVREKILAIQSEGMQKGEENGLKWLDEHYTVLQGSFTIVYSGPHQGKSQFVWEIAMNQAEFHGKKVAIVSPETGSPAEIYAELLWVYMRKPFVSGLPTSASASEIDQAMDFIDKHFFIIDPDLAEITVQDAYDNVELLEAQSGVDIDIVVLDPYTEFENAVSEGLRDDLAIGKDLNTIRKMSRFKNYHTLLTVHITRPRMQTPYKDADFQIPAMPHPSDMSGGQQWSRKGFCIINVHRMDYKDPMKGGYLEGHRAGLVRISIQKAKPKGVGKLGYVDLYYDKEKNRYFEWGPDSGRVYSHKYFSTSKSSGQTSII